jgi:hypothetical protein
MQRDEVLEVHTVAGDDCFSSRSGRSRSARSTRSFRN